MAGSNLRSKNRMRLRGLFVNYLTRGPGGGRLGKFRKTRPTFFQKHGVPASNTAADAPDRKGQICIDTLNDDVYHCTAYTNSTTFTWAKISD